MFRGTLLMRLEPQWWNHGLLLTEILPVLYKPILHEPEMLNQRLMLKTLKERCIDGPKTGGIESKRTKRASSDASGAETGKKKKNASGAETGKKKKKAKTRRVLSPRKQAALDGRVYVPKIETGSSQGGQSEAEPVAGSPRRTRPGDYRQPNCCSSS